MYTLTLHVAEHGKLLEQCLQQEVTAWERSSSTISQNGDMLDITIVAKDATALKATATMFVQLLTVFEKMKHGGQRH